MEGFEQLQLWQDYEPQVDDYVVWDKGRLDEDNDKGWVYFKCEEYITIETSVKPKPLDQYSKNDRHKMIHTLLLCPAHCWKELQYVKSRTPHEQIEHYSQCDD